MASYRMTVIFEGHKRNFEIKKDYFGNWSIYSKGDDFEFTGSPPFSVGHRTKRDAVKFLERFGEVVSA